MKPPLLIVEDDEDIRSQMKWALADAFEVFTAEDRAAALEVFPSARPHVVLMDLGLPPHPASAQEGFALLSELLAKDPLVKVVVVSGQSERENALKAVGEGAYDFLSKPVEMEELKLILKRVFHVAALEREYLAMQRRWSDGTFEGILGTSPPMQEVFNIIRKVATTDAPVLILGESGTGKELTALAVHRRSHRKDGPFVAINCSAIPESLLESELFGHEKGAFTGAHAQRKGRFEMARGGTLFLDEIGELPLAIQVKLLRFLQERYIERVGGGAPIQIDTRVVAATNADLPAAMTAGKFREDLYFRLAVVVLRLAPLRERTGDVMLLAKAFLQRFASENGKPKARFSADATEAILKHPWPGNVRELENRVKRAVIMCEVNAISAPDLELSGSLSALPGSNLREARESLEREMIQNALRRHEGKIAAAAVELGVSRPGLYELMEKLGIARE